MKLFSVYHHSSYDPFALIDDVVSADRPEDLTSDGVLLLHGGADISPSIYGQRTNQYCSADDKPNHRDRVEMDMIQAAKERNMPIIGICRGAQLLCAMDGGHLIQHIDNHASRNHPIYDTDTDQIYHANSCHHQMMVPLAHNKIIAIDKQGVNGYDKYNKQCFYKQVPEIVYFPQMNGLGIQGHPEWMPHSGFTKYCAELIKKYLFKE